MDHVDTGTLNRLDELLWGYRHALDRLEFCLAVQLSLGERAETRWNGHVTDLVAEVAERIGVLDLERELLLDGDSIELTGLIDVTPDPWPTILGDHQIELATAAERVRDLATRNQDALAEHRSSIRRLADRLAPAGTELGGYDRTGRSTSGPSRSVLFDGAV